MCVSAYFLGIMDLIIMLTTSSFTPTTTAVLGDTCGYIFQLEQIQLNAQLRVVTPHPTPVKVQLWACKQAYTGGLLEGYKIAETSANYYSEDSQITETVSANWPAGTESYVMVLTLVDEQNILSYINFSQTQIFLLPHLVEVSYQQTASDIVVNIGQIINPRSADNLSGTLCLELWALPETELGTAELLNVQILGVLAGQGSWSDYQLTASLPKQISHFSLKLLEWTGHGYITRDYLNFVVSVAAEVEAETVTVEELTESPQEKATPVTPSLNDATEADLTAIKGVSKSLAQVIKKSQPYSAWQQVAKLKGVGGKVLAKLQAVFVI